MPKVTMFFNPALKLSFRPPNDIEYGVQQVVCEALATRSVHLEPADITFIHKPTKPASGSMSIPQITFKIESIGFVERRQKMDHAAEVDLKNDLLAVLRETVRDHIFNPNDVLVKLKYT